MAMLRNPDEARDALQEVYTRVWTRAHLYNDTGCDPVAWIKVIARNTAIDSLRARKRGGTHEEFEDIHHDARGLSHSERITLSQCLERLDCERVELVKMVYIEGATYDEAVSRFGAPMNTVKSWLRRSLLQLKSCLSGDA